MEVYESEVRELVVKFCGWHSNLMPRGQEMPGGLQNVGGAAQGVARISQATFGADGSAAMSQANYEAVKRLEHGVKGGTMRATVMAALHFDFSQA